MSPRNVSDPLVRDTPVLSTTDSLEVAVRALLDTDLPALPVVEPDAGLAGILGEREFFAALFPGYLGQLHGAGFVTRSLESALEKRAACRRETTGQHMNTEHVDVGTDFSDAQVAEIFLHHRVLVLPVLDGRRVVGVITRGDFFRAVAERFLRSE
jgi:CBS-domain-containing membrane protein